jgi:hypothetical protein
MNRIIHAVLTSVVSLSLIVSLGGISYSQKSKSGPAKQPGTPLMWSEPQDIQQRDLFYGIGGKENAPDSSIVYKFISRTKQGTQPKIIVEDDKGRKWILKMGPEARPETTSTRIVWAAGYYVDQDYFLKTVRIAGEKNSIEQNVRLERLESKETDGGKWSWKSNPFVGTRELDGLKVLVALLRDVDVKEENNQIRCITRPDGSINGVYYISDLGATLGATGSFLNKVFFFRDAPVDRWNHNEKKANAIAFGKGDLVDEVEAGKVVFESRRSSVTGVLRGVSVENARWMGNILSKISPAQLSDAFRAGGFTDHESALFICTLQHRIAELRNLNSASYAKK